MALTRPVLLNMAAFDATQQSIFRFNVVGGDQVVKNRLVIRNNSTDTSVYDEEQTTFRFEHIVPANTLTNGTYYNATVYTFNNSDTSSAASNTIQFYCYTTPVLEFTNISESGVVNNSSYSFDFTYSQNENEPLNSYVINLHNIAGSIISTSGETYVDSTTVPLDLSYTFAGFEDGVGYGVEVIGTTINNTIIRTGIIHFSVVYTRPNVYTLLELRNNCAEGYVNILSNIAIIDGEVIPGPPVFIDNKELDLRQDGQYITWNTGYTIPGDFTGILVGRDFTPYKKIFQMSNINGDIIEINWLQGYENDGDETMKAYAQMNVKMGGDNALWWYTIKSEYIEIPADTQYITLWFRRINNIYELHIAETEASTS